MMIILLPQLESDLVNSKPRHEQKNTTDRLCCALPKKFSEANVLFFCLKQKFGTHFFVIN
jgi:hypothetical protein